MVYLFAELDIPIQVTGHPVVLLAVAPSNQPKAQLVHRQYTCLESDISIGPWRENLLNTEVSRRPLGFLSYIAWRKASMDRADVR